MPVSSTVDRQNEEFYFFFFAQNTVFFWSQGFPPVQPPPGPHHILANRHHLKSSPIFSGALTGGGYPTNRLVWSQFCRFCLQPQLLPGHWLFKRMAPHHGSEDLCVEGRPSFFVPWRDMCACARWRRENNYSFRTSNSPNGLCKSKYLHVHTETDYPNVYPNPQT